MKHVLNKMLEEAWYHGHPINRIVLPPWAYDLFCGEEGNPNQWRTDFGTVEVDVDYQGLDIRFLS